MSKYTILIVFSLAITNTVIAQKITFDGYVSDMQTVTVDSLDGTWVNDNLIHNRLNLKFYPHKNFSGGIEIRNRIFTGETVKYFPGYGDFIEADNGLIDMNRNLISEQSVIINSQIDRLWFTFEKDKWNITAGRQRINWGRSFVWNPNDIFNSYSFFDFDYIERPGSDALRVQYYTGAASSAELAIKADSAKNITAAGLYKFNFKGYDIQFMGGIINEQDYVIGTGWEGCIKSFSFRGEMSYVRPKSNFEDTTGVFIASLSTDYTFENSLMLQAEFLYNQLPETSLISSFQDFYYMPLTVKNLSFTEYNVFVSASYPVTPLWNVSLSGMYYPKLDGFYFGPTVGYSLNDNADFSVVGQSFSGEFENALTQEDERKTVFLIFLRLKMNF